MGQEQENDADFVLKELKVDHTVSSLPCGMLGVLSEGKSNLGMWDGIGTERAMGGYRLALSWEKSAF